MEKYKRLTKSRENIIQQFENIKPENRNKFCLDCFSRLAELEDDLESGKMIRLPCKVGDTVYRVMADKRIKQPYEYKVIGFWYSINNKCNDLHLGRYIDGVFVSSISVPFSEFNRILFLTKEEAEKKIKELKGEV